ncbi:MAG: hypothetical protein QXZ17_10980 [Nitrososphaerota archaeon]
MIDAFKKKTTREDKVMIVDDLKQAMSMREISFISGIPPNRILLRPQIQKCRHTGPLDKGDDQAYCI